MNERRKRFCLEYRKNPRSATQAAIKAGYKKETAYSQANRLLKNAEVQRYLAKLSEKSDREKVADGNEVMEYLTSVLRKLSQTKITDQATGETYVKLPDEKEALKAAELLGKCLGLFAERVQADVNMSPIVLRDDIHE